jgi:hypothetical protein
MNKLFKFEDGRPEINVVVLLINYLGKPCIGKLMEIDEDGDHWYRMDHNPRHFQESKFKGWFPIPTHE